MKRNFLLFLSIILLGTLQCSKVGAETGYLRFTVPTLGADSLCTTVQTTVPVRGVTLWWARSTGTDSLLTRSSKLFTPGSTDSVFVPQMPRGSYPLYIKAENNAGVGCKSNTVTVDFDGVPPAKVLDLGR